MTKRKDIAVAEVSRDHGSVVHIHRAGTSDSFTAKEPKEAAFACRFINEALDAVWAAAQPSDTAQNVIAALRDDVERLNQENTRLRDETVVLTAKKREIETSLVAARDARGEWERRARDAEAALDLIRGELGVASSKPSKAVLDELRARLDTRKEEDEEAESDALAEAHDAAELAILKRIGAEDGHIYTGADEVLKYCQAFSALRGAR